MGKNKELKWFCSWKKTILGNVLVTVIKALRVHRTELGKDCNEGADTSVICQLKGILYGLQADMLCSPRFGDFCMFVG